jgi:hypothetical protein
MSDNEFDDIIRKKLEQYEGEIPADMWQRIAIGKKKRRGVYKWYRYLIALLLLLVLVGVYEFFPYQNEKATIDNITNDDNSTQKLLDTTNISSSKNQEGIAAGKHAFETIATTRKFNHQTFQQSLQSGYQVFRNNEEPIVGHAGDTRTENDVSQYMIGDSLNADTAKVQAQKPTVIASTVADMGNDADSIVRNEEHDKISLQVFASPDIPFSTIHSSNSGYEKLLNDGIAMKLSYTIGASIDIAVNKRISLSSGIQYSRVNEKISGNDSTAGSYHLSNHFSFLNVPLLVSYKTRWTSSFRTSLKAGILVNISANYKGKMPDAFGALTDISHDTYLRNTGISVYTAVNFSKPVTHKLHFFAEPYFRFQAKNIANNLQPFTRKIQTAGLALGVEFKLYRDEKND